MHESRWRSMLSIRSDEGDLVSCPGRGIGGETKVHRSHRNVHAPLPHGGARGRRDDDAIRSRPRESNTKASGYSAATPDGTLSRGAGGPRSNFTDCMLLDCL